MMTDRGHLTEETVQAFVDGTADQPDLVRRHIAFCPTCSDAVRRQKQLHQALRETIPLVAPEKLAEAVVREVRLARRFAATTRLAGFFSMLFAGVATLGALGGIFWLSAAWRPTGDAGPVAAATRQASEWLELAVGGVSGFLSSLTSELLSGHQLVSVFAAVALAFSGVAVVDALLGKKLVRRTRTRA